MKTRRPILEVRLERAIISANRADERWAKKIDLLRARLHGKCTHTAQETYQWEHDNGYGKQSMNTGLRCILCRATRPYTYMGAWNDC